MRGIMAAQLRAARGVPGMVLEEPLEDIGHHDVRAARPTSAAPTHPRSTSSLRLTERASRLRRCPEPADRTPKPFCSSPSNRPPSPASLVPSDCDQLAAAHGTLDSHALVRGMEEAMQKMVERLDGFEVRLADLSRGMGEEVGRLRRQAQGPAQARRESPQPASRAAGLRAEARSQEQLQLLSEQCAHAARRAEAAEAAALAAQAAVQDAAERSYIQARRAAGVAAAEQRLQKEAAAGAASMEERLQHQVQTAAGKALAEARLQLEASAESVARRAAEEAVGTLRTELLAALSAAKQKLEDHSAELARLGQAAHPRSALKKVMIPEDREQLVEVRTFEVKAGKAAFSKAAAKAPAQALPQPMEVDPAAKAVVSGLTASLLGGIGSPPAVQPLASSPQPASEAESSTAEPPAEPPELPNDSLAAGSAAQEESSQLVAPMAESAASTATASTEVPDAQAAADDEYEDDFEEAEAVDAKPPRPPTQLAQLVMPWLQPLDYLRLARPAARAWSLDWYVEANRAVVVPDHARTINEAINASTGGLVLVRPAADSDSYKGAVRVARDCQIVGLGPDKVVVEEPGCESALVFVQDVRATVSNLTMRCKKQENRGKVVYIPQGKPLMERCVVEGGVHACGAATAPVLRRCVVRDSPGDGLHFDDGCRGSALECVVEGNKRHGVLVDRSARPELDGNTIQSNGGFGVRWLRAEAKASAGEPAPLADAPLGLEERNRLADNASGTCSVAGFFFEGEEELAEEEEEEDMVFSLFD